MDISLIDKNFKVETMLDAPDVRFYDVRCAPFSLHGVFYENGLFRRLPEAVARSVSPGVHHLHGHTAGGRVRFCTDSPYVALHVKMPSIGKMSHFALTGSAGFDLYVGDRYTATAVPPFTINGGFEHIFRFPTGERREITLHFPLYSGISALYIGLSEAATVEAPVPYAIPTPIVYYGSSITQGGCASRPGMAYEAILSRRFSVDHINLGFSGNAKGEDEMAEYLASLSMTAFVYDYDHNAPTVEHLRATHEKLFLRVRKAHPHLPVLMLSRPKRFLTAGDEERRQVVFDTYQGALMRGDGNVYFLDGPALMAMAGGEGTVDNCHPTDVGFASMAAAIGGVLETILTKKDDRTLQ